jgi:hypothetical protein
MVGWPRIGVVIVVGESEVTIKTRKHRCRQCGMRFKAFCVWVVTTVGSFSFEDIPQRNRDPPPLTIALIGVALGFVIFLAVLATMGAILLLKESHFLAVNPRN